LIQVNQRWHNDRASTESSVAASITNVCQGLEVLELARQHRHVGFRGVAARGSTHLHPFTQALVVGRAAQDRERQLQVCRQRAERIAFVATQECRIDNYRIARQQRRARALRESIEGPPGCVGCVDLCTVCRALQRRQAEQALSLHVGAQADRAGHRQQFLRERGLA